MVDITWLDIIESISPLAMENLLEAQGLKRLLSDVKIEKTLYIRCPCVSVSVTFPLLSLAKERVQNPTLSHGRKCPGFADSFPMRIMEAAQSLQSKGLAQDPGSATCNQMTLENTYTSLVSLPHL